ncbi:MAG: hypothetical protein CUN53_20230 [Phototrophicales bacterium]|nr:MAG: hypothetical protein CUN53_20230 [Phototrophicales bacterium]
MGAMASGLPVAASRIGGIPETLADGECGMLIPPDDRDALTEALLTLIRSPELRQRMGKARRLRAVEMFGMDGVTEALIAWYLRWISP